MKKASLLVLLILILPIALADGIAIRPYDYTIADVSQGDQLVYIDVEKDQYTTNLFVTFDFSDYDSDEMNWIVPFEDAPTDVQLQEATEYFFEEKFADFDSEINHAEELNKKHEEFPWSVIMVSSLEFVPFPVFALLSPLILLALLTTNMSMSDSKGLEANYDDLYGTEHYYFGNIGRADVYKISDKQTLRKFFEINGKEPPEELYEFLDKTIVVFRINKTKEELKTLVTFKFDNNGKIFYPSSTTHLYKELPRDYVIKIRAPLDYKLTPNFSPATEIFDQKSQYFVFSPWSEMQNYDYYRYEYLPPRESHELYNEDLVLEMEDEKKAVPIGMFILDIVPPWLIAIVLLFLSWIAASLAYSALTKKYNFKEGIIYGIILPIVWTVINLAFLLFFLIILAAGFLVLSILVSALSGFLYNLFSSEIYTFFSLFLLLLMFGLGIIDLIITVALFKILAVDNAKKILKWSKAKIGPWDFFKIYITALVLNIILSIFIVFLFMVPI
ncbi:MAG: hypothetical protein ABID38_01250 [Candidatus Diapherotrites archaeon]